jgi:hypothetical protein
MLNDNQARNLWNAFGPEAAQEAGLFSLADMVSEAEALMMRIEVGGGFSFIPGEKLATVVEGWVTTAYGPVQDINASGFGPDEAEAQAALVAEQAARRALCGRIAATGLLTPVEIARLDGRKHTAAPALAIA